MLRIRMDVLLLVGVDFDFQDDCAPGEGNYLQMGVGDGEERGLRY
jgi:hypothetical protein